MECNLNNTRAAKRIKQIDIFILILIFGFSIWGLVQYNYFNDEIGRGIGQYGLFGVFISTGLLELIPQLVHPFVSVIIASGMGINIWTATTIAAIASMAGSLAGFLIGRRYGFQVVCQLFKEKTIIETFGLWQKYGKEFVLVSALTPLPYLPLIFGALGLRKRQMFFWGVIPRFVGYFMFAWMYFYWLNLI